MLTRPRRTREYTGPTPHSVAIQVSFLPYRVYFDLKKKFDSKLRPKIFWPKFLTKFLIEFSDQIFGPKL